MPSEVIKGYPTPKKNVYKLLVNTITFNQSDYIVECLRGVAMQETTFPFIHIVTDDCSTDGEQIVIKTYMNAECDMSNAEIYDNDLCSIIITQNKTNPNCTLVVYFLKQNMYGNPHKMDLWKQWEENVSYEALCEGDDYWVDTCKLQKQVAFLDANPEYGIMHSNFYIRTGNTIKKGDWGKATNGDSLRDYIVEKYYICTPTVIYRTKLLKEIDNSYLFEGFKMGDSPLWMELMRLSKIIKLEDYTSAYRILENSASHSEDPGKNLLFIKEGWIVRRYIANKYAKDLVNITEKKIRQFDCLHDMFKCGLVEFVKKHYNNIGVVPKRLLIRTIKDVILYRCFNHR